MPLNSRPVSSCHAPLISAGQFQRNPSEPADKSRAVGRPSSIPKPPASRTVYHFVRIARSSSSSSSRLSDGNICSYVALQLFSSWDRDTGVGCAASRGNDEACGRPDFKGTGRRRIVSDGEIGRTEREEERRDGRGSELRRGREGGREEAEKTNLKREQVKHFK